MNPGEGKWHMTHLSGHFPGIGHDHKLDRDTV